MKKITAIILSCILLCISLLSPLQVHADNIYTYTKDAVETLRNLYGLFGDVVTDGYNFGKDLADAIGNALTPDMGVSYDSENSTFSFPVDENNNVIISQKFYNYAYDKVQEHVHSLDGYYLIEQNYDFTTLENYIREQSYHFNFYPDANYFNFVQCWLKNGKTYDRMFLRDCSKCTSTYSILPVIYKVPDFYHYVDKYGSGNVYIYSAANGSTSEAYSYTYYVGADHISLSSAKWEWRGFINSYTVNSLKKDFFYVGSPLKIFYSKDDLLEYLHYGKTYIPKINVNSTGIYIKQDYLTNNTMQQVINNVITNNNYDFSSNDEINIQTSIDNDVNIALSDLFSDGSDPVPTPTSSPVVSPGATGNPSPTPSDPFGDGTTPTPILTPIPVIDDDSSSWLEKIYEALTGFIESWGTYTDSLTQMLSETNLKLDDIITAIDKIASGETSGTSGGCKYDYTALSDFLTGLWNESDKKFDTMIELLKENNEYQQKLVDSLNQIKAILVADTVMDFFKDRSNETANTAKDKFPTSIPWDIAMVVNAMCATPEEPVIRCPIVISSLGINEEIVIDLSSEEWKKLAKTCRSLLSILFILYLVHLSRELFFKGGDN